VIFQDFPGPGIFKKKNPGLSRRRGNPDYYRPAVETKIVQAQTYALYIQGYYSDGSLETWLCNTE